ncbi:fused MFS/spermidine synthase [Planctomycetota bacterium]|nr:fused MFS/spermidine synthase [Planctomycetota bacterium]
MNVRPLALLVAFTFLGAVLLFGLEPLVGKLLLPAFGGGFHVWATCLMFFQGVLFAGYVYCHFVAPRLGRWHLVVVALPIPLLLIMRAFAGLQSAEPDPHSPITSILALLMVAVAIPFGVLSTTGVVAQRWLADSTLAERNEPYQLYAASNAGSLIALLGYPLLIEPFVTLQTQRYVWTACYAAYAILAFVVARSVLRTKDDPAPEATPAAEGVAPPSDSDATPETPTTEPAPDPEPPVEKKKKRRELLPDPPPEEGPPSWRTLVYWFLLAAVPSAFLLAVTNVIAIDVGSVPMVWVLPLSIYLLTFILAFRTNSYVVTVALSLKRRFWLETSLVGLYFFVSGRGHVEWKALAVHLLTLFVLCNAAHYELHRVRPKPKYLTIFYLVMSGGGWAGGVFVSLVAPNVFPGLWEYPLAIGALALIFGIGRWRAFVRWLDAEPWPLIFGSIFVISVVTARVIETEMQPGPEPVKVMRNFYGIYQIHDYDMTDDEEDPRTGTIRRITHGTTLHGKQYVGDDEKSLIPLGYYHTRSPLGDVMRLANKPRRGAVIGLGAGATAAYFQRGEEVVFYELDPDVASMVKRPDYFTYLDQCPAQVRLVVGDAKVSMARDPLALDGYFDVILVDAFSSDSIPTHLLTKEALDLYAQKLAPGGFLVFHISNRYYDLRPVLLSTATICEEELFAAYKTRLTRLDLDEDPSDYLVFHRDPEALAQLRRQGWTIAADSEDKLVKLTPWTDDYANIMAALWAHYERRRGLRSELDDDTAERTLLEKIADKKLVFLVMLVGLAAFGFMFFKAKKDAAAAGTKPADSA